MSEDRFNEIEAKLGVLNKIVTLGYSLLFGAFCLGCWATLLEIRTQGAQKAIEELKTESTEITNWRYEINGSRYTAVDHNRFAVENSAQHTLADKRLTRLEDGAAEIKKSLDRIETRLQTKP